jgi:hypothetical protein
MTSAAYMSGRRRYQRPQGMLWSNNPGTLQDGFYFPQGYEVNADYSGALENEFLILSDNNRSPIDFSFDRIESRKRMINGRMRSYHIADKLKITISWDMLPSRSYALDPNFEIDNENGRLGKSQLTNTSLEYTTDGGAGGVDMLDWYESHTGPFWVFLAYDKFSNFPDGEGKYGHLNKYNEVMEMYFADFSYSVVKRGGSNFDFWNVSLTLEEV